MRTKNSTFVVVEADAIHPRCLAPPHDRDDPGEIQLWLGEDTRHMAGQLLQLLQLTAGFL